MLHQEISGNPGTRQRAKTLTLVSWNSCRLVAEYLSSDVGSMSSLLLVELRLPGPDPENKKTTIFFVLAEILTTIVLW
jgi:hypothetical protein